MKDSEHKQFYKPYSSTIEFEKFLIQNKLINSKTENIIDIGTGIGANLHYFSKRHKNINFTGIDYSKNRIQQGKSINKNKKIKLKKIDILNNNFNLRNKFDGAIMIHALCCFKKLDQVISKICKLNTKWIAINSLFYEGNLDVLIQIKDHNNIKTFSQRGLNNNDGDFNIFSLIQLKKIFSMNGYKLIKKKPYFPTKKIPKPSRGSRGSYTIKTEFNKFTTFSGPIYLPWYFIYAVKK